MARHQRDIPAALGYARCALATARQGCQRREENVFLGYIAGLLYDQGDLDGSFQHRKQALDGALAVGDYASAAYFMVHLADIHLVRLELDKALDLLDQARENFG